MHILDEVKYLIQNSKTITYKEFINNETIKRSFVRSLEVIGEATIKYTAFCSVIANKSLQGGYTNE